MKKSFQILVATAMLLSVTLNANAQFSKKENNREPDRFHMGLRAGITNNTFYGDADGIDPLLFVTGGLALDFQVAPIPLFLGTGLNVVDYGYTQDYNDWDDDIKDNFGIQMPLTVSYHINAAPNLFINPFVGGFVGYCPDSPHGFDDEAVNYGLKFGVGINFGRLTFDIGYDLGLSNLSDYDGDDFYSSTFFATIGFNWAGSR